MSSKEVISTDRKCIHLVESYNVIRVKENVVTTFFRQTVFGNENGIEIYLPEIM